jgi:uncharacterized protein YdhG (YjbR/CyaY superfamily)
MKPASIDEYLSRLTSDKRAALEKLRRAIKAAAPKAEECISYQIPAFRLDGKVLVWFGAASNHLSFFPGAAPIKALAAELAEYDTRKGTIHFSPEHPLPATLVRKLVKSRIAEYASAPRRGKSK